jgi:hypothetical protein
MRLVFFLNRVPTQRSVVTLVELPRPATVTNPGLHNTSIFQYTTPPHEGDNIHGSNSKATKTVG